METINSFGYYVRRRRKALDMTQRQLAEVAGCALVTLKKIETDQRRPSPAMAARLAECLALPEAERPAFMAAARGNAPVDRLAASHPPALFPPRDVVPAATSPLLGRESEISTLLGLLATEARLVTIVGPGGIGKTRLALAAAAALQQIQPRPFPAGIVFVDLAAVTEAGRVIPAIAAALDFQLATGGGDSRPPLEQVASFLRRRDLLLILDNLEQLDGARRVLDALLRATASLKILATSRERIDLPWEHLVVLSGLDYPAAAGDPAAFPAGRLFLARARRLRPDYVPAPADRHALNALCALVDGLPLALELAAAWIDTLTLPEITAELRHDLGTPGDGGDRPERHRSLRAVWDSAWARLAPAERAAFAQLCVFRGGFTRAAAESVTGVTLGLLGRLTSKYLITFDRDAGRYRIHELLRQYGYANLLALGGAADSHQRHLDYWLRFSEELAPRIHGPEQTAVLNRIASESDNLTAALEWGLGAPERFETTARLMSALHWYWRIRSKMAEASAWLDRALEIAPAGDPNPAVMARLLFGAGHFAWMHGAFALARDRHLVALAHWQAARLEDSLEAAATRQHLAMSYGQLGEPAAAAPHQTTALARFRELDATWWVAFILPQVAQNRQAVGDPDGAREAAEEHLRLVARLGDPWLTGLGRLNLGDLAWRAGDLPQARRLIGEGLAAQRMTGHSHSVGAALMMLGEIAREEGDEAAAAGYFGEAVALYEAMGHERYAAEARAMLP